MAAPKFVFTGYIISVIDDRRICVRVDPADVERVSTTISNYADKTTIKDTVVVNVREARFLIKNIEWSELNDLIGVHIKFGVQLRRYSYWRTRELFDDDNDSHVTTVKYKGISVIANHLTNI